MLFFGAMYLFFLHIAYLFAVGVRAIGCVTLAGNLGETKKQRNEGSAATKLNFVRYFLSIFHIVGGEVGVGDVHFS